MKMTFRWFAFGHDSVTLKQIKQIPGMAGVVTSILDIPVGEVWPLETLERLKNEVTAAGLEMDVIESVNVHEDIKLGLPTRDTYIENYIECIKNLSAVGVKVLCYNFMPVLDWARSELNFELPDGSFVLSYRHAKVLEMDPSALANKTADDSFGFELPGWESERLKQMPQLIEAYKNINQEQYFKNAKYFLDAVIPAAEKYGVKMAIHPDDPPWPIFGLPRIMTSRDNVRKYLDLHKSEYNGLTLCSGSLGANRSNDIPSMIREFGSEGRIHFVHLRNVIHHEGLDFDESAHLSRLGSLDMYEIMKSLVDVNFSGYVRPDHGRMIWDEVARPGYGLYDRALGATYLLGLHEAIVKNKR